MTCLDCGRYVPEDKLKPCTALYKHNYPDGVPVCDDCCKKCADTPAFGGIRQPCIFLQKEQL